MFVGAPRAGEDVGTWDILTGWGTVAVHVPAGRILSQQPSAVRKREYRERLKSRRTPPAGVPIVPPVSVPPASTTFETVPLTGPGPDAFASLPFVPSSSSAGPDAAAADAGTPIVDTPPAASSPVTEAEAQGVAMAVVTFFQLGCAQLLAKRPTLHAMASRAAPPEKLLADASALVYASSTRLAMKYNVRAADEAVVGIALGVATLGFVAKPEKRPANENAAAAAAAKDANPDTSTVPSEDKPRADGGIDDSVLREVLS